MISDPTARHPVLSVAPTDNRRRGLTLLEVMIAMFVMAVCLLGFLDAFLSGRRVAEESVLEAASTTVISGLIEQMKMIDFDEGTPIRTTDSEQATYDAFPGASAKTAPYIRVRLNQHQVTWLQCVENTNTASPQGPTTTPTSLAGLNSARRNTIGPLALSSVAGTTSQPLTLNLWVWVDHIAGNDVSEARVITVVYAFDVNEGSTTRTLIRRLAFVRTAFGRRNNS